MTEATIADITVAGEPLTEIPADLFIPPEALRVELTLFNGPLDLLLYLIRRNNLDIMDIPIAEVSAQYVRYIEMMQALDIALAADYLVMAATLAEIKSALLLPAVASDDNDDVADPRAELAARLQAYQRFQAAATVLAERPQLGRDVLLAQVTVTGEAPPAPPPEVSLTMLKAAYSRVLTRLSQHQQHYIKREALSIRERMTNILQQLQVTKTMQLSQLLTAQEGSMGVAVTLMAILELVKQQLLQFEQPAEFAPITVMS